MVAQITPVMFGIIEYVVILFYLIWIDVVRGYQVVGDIE